MATDHYSFFIDCKVLPAQWENRFGYTNRIAQDWDNRILRSKPGQKLCLSQRINTGLKMRFFIHIDVLLFSFNVTKLKKIIYTTKC
jgi:hypothetical protein